MTGFTINILLYNYLWILPSANAEGTFYKRKNITLRILSEKFYDTYSHCKEILKKKTGHMHV